MTGTGTSKGWHHSTTTPSQDWEEDRWKLPSTGTTSFLITLNSSYQEGATAPVTCAHSGQEKTHIPDESSPVKRHIPSSQERHSPQWSTSPSNKRETKPFVLKYNASEVPTTESETWPRTWPISRNCTMTHDGRNRTPCGPLPVPMPFTALSHASSTMPR
jgi:hypothetical protein